MEHHVPKITGPLLAKWCLLDKICQCWKLSEDFSDLFAHVNLMLDIVFDVQKVAKLLKWKEVLFVYKNTLYVSYHDFILPGVLAIRKYLKKWEHSVKLRFDIFGPFCISSHNTWPRRKLATLLGFGTPQQAMKRAMDTNIE